MSLVQSLQTQKFRVRKFVTRLIYRRELFILYQEGTNDLIIIHHFMMFINVVMCGWLTLLTTAIKLEFHFFTFNCQRARNFSVWLYIAANRIKCIAKIDITIVGFINVYFLVDWNGFVCFCHGPSTIRYCIHLSGEAGGHTWQTSPAIEFSCHISFQFFYCHFVLLLKWPQRTHLSLFIVVECLTVCTGIDNWLTFNHIMVHFNRNTFSIARTSNFQWLFVQIACTNRHILLQ